MGKLDGTKSFMSVLVLALMASAAVPASSLGWVLELAPEAQLGGPTIHLGDICLGEMPAAVSEVVLRDDVRPGETYNLSRRMLLRQLVGLRLAENISFSGAESCRVLVDSRELAAQDLQQVLFEQLAPWRPADKPQAPTGWLELVGSLPRVQVDGPWQMALVEPEILASGRNLVKVRIDAGGRTTRFTATINCHLFAETARSHAAIAEFAPLDEALFTWQWQDLADMEPGLLVGRERIAGNVCASEIPADTMLRQSHLRITPLVRQGEPVELILGRGGVELTLIGICREDGVQGQIVAVRNNLDGRLISGRVIGPNRVAWRK